MRATTPYVAMNVCITAAEVSASPHSARHMVERWTRKSYAGWKALHGGMAQSTLGERARDSTVYPCSDPESRGSLKRRGCRITYLLTEMCGAIAPILVKTCGRSDRAGGVSRRGSALGHLLRRQLLSGLAAGSASTRGVRDRHAQNPKARSADR